MSNQNENKSSKNSIHNLIKIICVIVYFISLIVYYVCMASLLSEIFKGSFISALHVFLIIFSMFVAPIVLLVLIYPFYALAHLCQKADIIDDRQKEIEMLVAKIVVEEREANNHKDN